MISKMLLGANTLFEPKKGTLNASHITCSKQNLKILTLTNLQFLVDLFTIYLVAVKHGIKYHERKLC